MEIVKNITKEIVNIIFGSYIDKKIQGFMKKIELELRGNKQFDKLVANPEFNAVLKTEEEFKVYKKKITRIFLNNIFSYESKPVSILLDNYGIHQEEVKSLFFIYYKILENITIESLDPEFKLLCCQLKQINEAISENYADTKNLILEIQGEIKTKFDNLREDALKVISNYNNEFWYYILFLVKKCKEMQLVPLTGREKLLEDIYDWIKSVEENNKLYQYACLIGKAGIGKTRIAQELVRNIAYNGEIVYVGYEEIDKLSRKIKSVNGIEIHSNCIFIFDYIYEKVNKINEIIIAIKKNCGRHKVGFITIERDTTEKHLSLFEEDNYVSFNLESYTELNINQLSQIIADEFKLDNKCELPENFREKCKELAREIKERLNEGRPIFAIMVGDIYCKDYYINKCETDIRQCSTMQSLLKHYWEHKCTDSYILHKLKGNKNSHIRDILNKCDKLAKILVLIKNITKVEKLEITLSTLPFFKKEDIECSDIEICQFIWQNALKDLNALGVNKQKIEKCMYYFLKEYAISNEMDASFKIVAEFDLLIEWILYNQYIIEKEDNQWLHKLIPLLMKEKYINVFLPMIYRAANDFKDITEIISVFQINPYREYLFDFTRKIIENEEIQEETIKYFRFLIEMLWTIPEFERNNYLQTEFEIDFVALFKEYKNQNKIDGPLKDFVLCKVWLNNLPGKESEDDGKGRVKLNEQK